METLFDKNDQLIVVGMYVEVPEPNEFDNHQNRFEGYVEELRVNGDIIVSDDEGDCFAIEANRVEII